MHSLLTEELKRYDIDNKNISENSNKYINKIEKVVSDKFNKSIDNYTEYGLNSHKFNPTKNSPPNEWQYRLLKRINSLNFNDIVNA